MILEEVLRNIENLPPLAWLYLPRDAEWNFSTRVAILESEEVSQEDEDLPDAGIPEFAIINNLRQVLPVTALQEIMTNLKHSRPYPTSSEMLVAFKFYWENDAFGPH